jgi:hypothetical protein
MAGHLEEAEAVPAALALHQYEEAESSMSSADLVF